MSQLKLTFSFPKTVNIVSHLDSNLIKPGDEQHLTPESIASRIRGSKLVLVTEHSMLVTIWGCKICLLLMYNKITFGLAQQLAVKILAGYVVINFVVMEILYLGVWCRPISDYWKVPVENSEYLRKPTHFVLFYHISWFTWSDPVDADD